MKFFALLAAIALSTNAYSETSLKKTFDGGVAKCQDMADVGTRAYKLEIVEEKVNGENKDITMNVLFYKCAEVPSGYGLRQSSASEILNSFILLPNGNIGMTKNKLVKVLFSAVDASDRALSSQVIRTNSDKYLLTVTLNKNVKKAFIQATFISDISSPLGNVESAVEHLGGFVLAL